MTREIPIGTEVATSRGRAVIVKKLQRGAGSIRTAAREVEFDRTPYSVRYSDGSHGMILGGEVNYPPTRTAWNVQCSKCSRSFSSSTDFHTHVVQGCR